MLPIPFVISAQQRLQMQVFVFYFFIDSTCNGCSTIRSKTTLQVAWLQNVQCFKMANVEYINLQKKNKTYSIKLFYKTLFFQFAKQLNASVTEIEEVRAYRMF